MSLGRVVFRGHAIKRMFQRRIGGTDVRRVIESGETIETIRKPGQYLAQPVVQGPRTRRVDFVGGFRAGRPSAMGARESLRGFERGEENYFRLRETSS